MGLFFKRKKKTVQIPIGKISISATLTTRIINDEEKYYMDNGYKEDGYGNYYESDTVWVGSKRSKVYHEQRCCCGYVISDDPMPMPESEAIRRGYVRCKKCHWEDEPPEAGSRPSYAEIVYTHDDRYDVSREI